MPDDWNAAALSASPIHGDLIALTGAGHWPRWPGVDQLNDLVAGSSPRFVLHADAGHDGAVAYEAHIAGRGEIPLRPHSWHDLFNALVWALFPACKAALNAAHIKEAPAPGENRSARRDAVTLLDECGVILAVAEQQLTRLHAQHRWRELFVAERDAWGQRIAPLVIGHGLYEQCLRPYVGLTAKALHVGVPADWFAQPLAARYRTVDALLAGAIANDTAVMTTAELLPLPVLGVPGWWDANREARFYDNEQYFRPKAQKKRPAQGRA